MTGYAQARKDFEYLESLELLGDQVELDAERECLMQEPTKKKAAELYCVGVRLWFGEARRDGRQLNRRAKAIARRHGED